MAFETSSGPGLDRAPSLSANEENTTPTMFSKDLTSPGPKPYAAGVCWCQPDPVVLGIGPGTSRAMQQQVQLTCQLTGD